MKEDIAWKSRSRMQKYQQQSSVWVRLAAAFWAKMLGTSGTVKSLRMPSGKSAFQDATLQFM